MHMLTMSKRKQYADDNLRKALNFINNKQGSIREASKKFNVPRTTLQFKIRNPDKKSKPGPDPVLTEYEEEELCNFIIELSRRGFPIKKEDLLVCVQRFLAQNPRPNPFKDNKPGECWYKSFLKRHPNISSRTSAGVTNASSCVSEKDIRKWFQEISQYFIEDGLTEVLKDASRVFNADETGFNICPKSGKVLAEKGSKNVYQIEKAPAKENITVLFTFSALGLVCNPMIIYPYKRIPDKVALSVPSGWGIGRSDSGWMTAAVFYDYIENCFYKELMDKNIRLPVILFVDGHKTHITIEVAELCRGLQIHLVALYPNATRILQPADVAAFRPIKVGWKKALQEWYAENNHEISMNKERFAPLLKKVVLSSAKKETLINGFRVCGLFPFDANNVDYSKCIASSKPDENPAENYEHEFLANHVPNLNVLTYADFYNIIGPGLITKCQQKVDNLQVEFDESFNAIYRLWQKFTGRELSTNFLSEQTRNELQVIETAEFSVEDHVEIEPNHIILDDQTGELRNYQDKKTEEPKSNEIDTKKQEANVINAKKEEARETKASDIKTIQRKANESEAIEFEVKEVMTIRQEIGVADATENERHQGLLSPDFDQQPGPSRQSDPDKLITKIKEAEQMHANGRNHGLSDPYFNPQPGPSRQRDANKLITVISNQSLSEYLKKKIPGSPKRKGGRQTERLPFALTSDIYVDKLKTKQLKKQENETAKEERKRIREEKKLQKENAVPKKKAKKLSTKTKTTTIRKDQLANRIICCDSCLCPIRKRVIECSQCFKKFHLNCIPSFHRIHVPEEDDSDDSFMCNFCYRETNTDSSEGDTESLFSLLRKEAKN